MTGYQELEIYDSVFEYARDLVQEQEEDYSNPISTDECRDEFKYLATFQPSYKIVDYRGIETTIYNNVGDYSEYYYQKWRDDYNGKEEMKAVDLLQIIKCIKEDYGEIPDNLLNNSLENVWTYVLNDCISYIIGDLEDDETREMERLDYEYEEAVTKIQKAWSKCRWNPNYKMCRTCQFKDLQNICEEYGRKDFIQCF